MLGNRLATEVRKDFAGDVAFEAANNLGLALSLRRAALHVVDRWLMASHARHDNPVECRVSLSVTATV